MTCKVGVLGGNLTAFDEVLDCICRCHKATLSMREGYIMNVAYVAVGKPWAHGRADSGLSIAGDVSPDGVVCECRVG